MNFDHDSFLLGLHAATRLGVAQYVPPPAALPTELYPPHTPDTDTTLGITAGDGVCWVGPGSSGLCFLGFSAALTAHGHAPREGRASFKALVGPLELLRSWSARYGDVSRAAHGGLYLAIPNAAGELQWLALQHVVLTSIGCTVAAYEELGVVHDAQLLCSSAAIYDTARGAWVQPLDGSLGSPNNCSLVNYPARTPWEDKHARHL